MVKIYFNLGIMGIVFRFTDKFNYYTAEYYDEKLYFKVVKDGEISEIASAYIDNYYDGTRYNF
jgi:hypothetical protein